VVLVGEREHGAEDFPFAKHAVGADAVQPVGEFEVAAQGGGAGRERVVGERVVGKGSWLPRKG
jgi:hypothetical protein